MKIFTYTLFLMLVSIPAWAANTPPAGADRDIIFNDSGRYGGAVLGDGLQLTTTAGTTTLSTTAPPPPVGDFIMTETGDPIVTETGDNIVTETSP